MDHRITELKLTTARQWYIWYTKPRAEKKVKERLENGGFQVFLPVYKELRQWSDRKKWIEKPLFNGYIFVNVDMTGFDRISHTEGILNYVRFNGRPAFLRPEEVEEIKLLLVDPLGLEVDDLLFEPGERIEIMAGPLVGMQGEIVNHRGNKKLAVRLEALGKAILVQLPKIFVKKRMRA